ncbi:hypothetical protein C0993_005681 [Termitomyces sp. T159_Od127]|nr:hypothetical protein C0993_005681 [Termitomyces sp. T159_Od127]
MFATGLVFSLVPVLIVAQQYGAPPPTFTSDVPAPSAPPNTQGHMNVDVYFQNTFTFHPANFTAPNNTQVTFWFPDTPELEHSVTQSSFENPCTYLTATANNSAGFDSGLQHAVTFNITITDDTKPIWFHCKQVFHCSMGMVGSINAPTTGNITYDAFHQAALNIGASEVTETDKGPVLGGFNANASATPASSIGGANSNYLHNLPLASLIGSFGFVLLMI